MHNIYTDTECFGLSPGYLRALGTFAPQSVAVNSGSFWKLHRKVVVSAFAPIQLKFATTVVLDQLDILISKWKKQMVVNVPVDLAKFTLDIIGLVAFQHHFNTQSIGIIILIFLFF